jgi:hypothetical protein
MKKLVILVLAALMLFVCIVPTFAEEIEEYPIDGVTFISLSEVYRMLEWEDIYTPGLMYVTVTFTEADTALLNVNVDTERVDYHTLQNGEWCVSGNQLLIRSDVVSMLVEEI